MSKKAQKQEEEEVTLQSLMNEAFVVPEMQEAIEAFVDYSLTEAKQSVIDTLRLQSIQSICPEVLDLLENSIE